MLDETQLLEARAGIEPVTVCGRGLQPRGSAPATYTGQTRPGDVPQTRICHFRFRRRTSVQYQRTGVGWMSERASP